MMGLCTFEKIQEVDVQPAPRACIPPTTPPTFLFRANVYSFKGPGRVVRGFPDDVQVVGSAEFLGGGIHVGL
jgi:hypothetical protein